MFYLIVHSYEPGTAATNRILGYLKTFSTEKIETTVVFVYPDAHRNVITDINPFITYRYLWKEHFFSRVKPIEIALRFIYPRILRRLIHSGDTVFLYGCIRYCHEILKKKGAKVYLEVTEHYESYPQGNRITGFPLQKHYKDVTKLNGLFVISTCLHDFYLTKGVNPAKICIVNMTVDPTRFSDLEKDATEKYIAYCGVIYNSKDGVDQLIRSYALVTPTHPDVKLLIIGPTLAPTEQNDNLNLVKELKLEDKVVLTGNVSSQQMPQILKNATICALDRPDGLRAQAGFPTKLGEYLLSANPVVITNVGDIHLFLKDGESAFLAEPDNIASFAEKLNWVLDNPDEAIKVGRQGYKVAMANFNSEVETKKIISFIFNR